MNSLTDFFKKKTPIKRVAMVQNVLEYILETEAEDFINNPSPAHVYFQAYAATHGIDQAEKMLRDLPSDAALTLGLYILEGNI